MYLERQNNPVVTYHLKEVFVLETGLLFIVDFFSAILLTIKN